MQWDHENKIKKKKTYGLTEGPTKNWWVVKNRKGSGRSQVASGSIPCWVCLYMGRCVCVIQFFNPCICFVLNDNSDFMFLLIIMAKPHNWQNLCCMHFNVVIVLR